MSMRSLGAALVLGLGLAATAVGSAPATADTPAVRLAIAVPIVVPSSADGFLDADTLARYTSASGLLTRQLDSVIDRPVALAIDPRIIVSIRLLGDTAPPSAVAWLDRLGSATNETFALGYGDADVTLQTQAGSGSVLQPETVDFAIDPARFAPSPGTATPQPTAAPDDQALPALPTSAEVLDWPYSLTGIAWPRDDTAISSDLPAIAASGYQTTILSSDNVARDAASGPTAQVDSTGVLVSDAPVSAALRATAGAPVASDLGAVQTALSDAVAAAARVQPGTPTLFATLDRATALRASGSLAEALTGLEANPGIQLVRLSDVLEIPPAAATVVDKAQPADLVSRAGQMIQGEAAERVFASVATDPAAITSSRRLELLTLLSVAWQADLDGWAEAADAFTTASIELRNSVHLVKTSNFLLVADNDQYLPITVNNALDQPVRVFITVRSQSALLVIDQQRVELDIEAGAQAKKNVPVHSLSNGVVEVDVTLTSATSAPIGAPISSEVNVQAGWETPIVVAFAAAVVVVFGVGIVRTVLRRRRSGSSGD
jgi:hypothetical protein